MTKKKTVKRRRELLPDTEERAKLIKDLREHIQKWEGTQAEKADALGITQPRLNDLLKNRIEKFSLDALVSLVNKTGRRANVETQEIWPEKVNAKLEKIRPVIAPEENQLERMDATEGTDLILNLLRSEAIANGLSPKDIVLSKKINIKDGGIDAKVLNASSTSGLISEGNTYYQIKTGKSFKPWTLSSLKRELFGENKVPSKQNLGDEIRHCLDQNSTYVIVNIGHELGANQHSKSMMYLMELLTKCGYSDPKIAVYGQRQLIGELEKYPSLCLSLAGFVDDRILTIDGWKKFSQMQVKLELGEEQKQFIDDIQTVIHNNTIQHVRIIGEPGIGKTRLVLEAVSTDDIAPSVLYVPTGEDFQKSRFFNELIKPDLHRAVTLVVDDCDDRDRTSIWSALKGREGIKLITIDHGPEETRDNFMQTFYCPQLPDEQIKNILFSYLQQQHDLTNWAEWCSGSPRVAHAVGENLKSNPEDILKTPADVEIWDRFITGHKGMNTQEAEQHRLVLRHIALFQKFGFEEPVSDEAQFIAKRIQQDAPLITWAKFQSIVEYYRKKRILQGRHTLFIVPKALHIHLWVEYWNKHGRGFKFQAFLEELPKSMKNWFLSLFIYAHGSDAAQDVVKKILSEEGPFSEPEFLESEVGLRFIRYLSEADPESTLELLKRTVGSWPHEKLKNWHTGRQDIVWALERIAVWQEHFTDAIDKVLIPMALAENASNSNNSKGLLFGLFTVGLGWAPTQASPAKRYPILQNLIRSKDAKRRILGIELCKAWLETHGGFRIIGAEYQGLKPTVEFWRPETYGDLYKEWRKVLKLFCIEMKGLNVSDRNKVADIIVDAADGFMHVAPMVNEVLDIIFELAEDKEIDRKLLTRFVIFQLNHHKDKLDETILKRFYELDEKLTGTSLWDRTNRYVLHTNWDEDYRTRGDNFEESNLPSKRVKKIAEEYIQDISALSQYITKLTKENGHRLHELGLECGKLAGIKVDEIIIDYKLTGHPDNNGIFLGGYLAGVRFQDESRWEKLLHQLLHNDTTREIAIHCIWSSGFTESLLRDLLNFYKQKKIAAKSFQRFAFRQDNENVPDKLFQEIVHALLDQGDEVAIKISTELVQDYYFDKNKKSNVSYKNFPEELVFKVLIAKPVDDIHEHMYGYYWEIIARKFLSKHPNRRIEIFNNIMNHMGRLSRYGSNSYIAKIADEIVKELPHETWEIVAKRLVSEPSNYYEITHWLGDSGGFGESHDDGAIRFMPAKEIINWIKSEPEERRWLIREVLPKTLDVGENLGGELTRLFIEEFCDDEEIANSLWVHFHMGGWSGPESSYLSNKRDVARRWMSEIESGKIQIWLEKYIKYLGNRIERCKIQEEREF